MYPKKSFEIDIFQTSAGELEITFLGHGTLMFKFNEKIIHIDPYAYVAEYQDLPKADLILITHEHRDHLDPDALIHIRTKETEVVLTEICAQELEGGTVMANGEMKTVMGIPIEAVPAYNIVHTRETGEPFHPKGDGNGYVLTFGDTRVYIGADTEDIPEMDDLRDINIAFLPMNLPYTMTPEMAAKAAIKFHPKILYPYHFGDTDTSRVSDLLSDHADIEVRIRQMA